MKTIDILAISKKGKSRIGTKLTTAIVDHEGYELLRPSTKQQWLWSHLQKLVA